MFGNFQRRTVIKKTCQILLVLLCAHFILIGLKYYYFANFMSFPLHNVSQILEEISVHGASTTTPINKVHQQTHFIYTADSTCKVSVTLLIVVKSKVDNFVQRNTIRQTWGKFANTGTKVVFILGYDETVVKMVAHESSSNKDIVQGSFIDTYYNNTYKTIMTYNWIVQYCSKTEYVLFVDDDIFVHIPNILKYIEDNFIEKTENKMYGRLIYMARPIREKQSKWYTSETEYPFDFWFPYLGGGTILTNHKVVQNIALAIPYVKFVWIDDAYVGIVVNKLDITLKHESGFVLSRKTVPEKINQVLTSHGYEISKDMISVYSFEKHVP